MSTPTQAVPFRLDRIGAFRAAADAPLTRSQLRDLAMELRGESARLERTLTPGGVSPELDEIRRALQRIDERTYGICIVCDGQIPFGRLQVMPATQRCVRCAR